MSELNISCWVLINMCGLGKGVEYGRVWLDDLLRDGEPLKLNGGKGMALLQCEQRQERREPGLGIRR